MKTKKLMSILVLIVIIAFAWGTYNIALKDFRLTDTNYTYLGGLTWYHSASGLNKGLQDAQKENKPVLMYFWAVWCQYCAEFDANTLGNPQVKNILQSDYVLVAMDLDVDKDVANTYRVSYPPYVIFMDPKGNVLERVTGYVGPDSFLPMVKQIRDKVRSK